MIEGVQESLCHVEECSAAAAIKAFMAAITPQLMGKAEPPHYGCLTGIKAGKTSTTSELPMTQLLTSQ